MGKQTPMLMQYNRIKQQYPDCLVFFRLGDFYELFGPDAEIAAQALDITLTSREAGKGKRIPMCGVPHHAADSYLATLVQKGHKVAICEQLEDPRTAKGIVKRDVVRIVTPGTAVDETLKPGQNRYLAAVTEHRGVWGIAICDFSTGEFLCTEIKGENAFETVLSELHRVNPSELLMADLSAPKKDKINELGFYSPEVHADLFNYDLARQALLNHFKVLSLEGFGCEGLREATKAAGAIISYLRETQKTEMAHISRLVPYSTAAHMVLDQTTRRNLELTRTLRDGERHATLLWVLDQTRTPMGARLLKTWLEQPLLNGDAINHRLDAVEGLTEADLARSELRELLKKVYDLPRLASRVALRTANGRDMNALARSLRQLPAILPLVEEVAQVPSLRSLLKRLDPCSDIAQMIEEALVESPPVSIQEGGLIRPGFNDEVDRLREAQRDGKAWISDLEQQEREKTGIKSLKVGFNRVFGYYIEVTRANLNLVPEHYERKQTLAGSERFVTPELKEKEALILGAEERVTELEYQLFCELRDRVAKEVERIQVVADALAELDVYCSLAQVARDRHYVRPRINTAGRLSIKAGRHPVVEAVLDDGSFVPNDIHMDAAKRQIMILTGPNMAGKSTYLRQTTLLVLLAHIGSFVPAESADITLVDRIFTRVGASDDLATGQSTFMVEMNEVAHILNCATEKSLVILDEVGRGTSTFDGLSIAWAVTEYLHNSPDCRPLTLFATHYHELTELAQLLPRVHNCCVAVAEKEGDVVFLRRIVPGSADRSYGIEVARLAGLPEEVIESARRILSELESTEHVRLSQRLVSGSLLDGVPPVSGVSQSKSHVVREVTPMQIPLFVPEPSPSPLVSELAEIDAENMTPLAALTLIFTLRERARQELEGGNG
ncbi:MAG: DNA mismatch repair protein MutS [Firmicutes bacterium]|nr:DNA mismatch repair protein MutS [Bacillota bacterium]